MLGLVGDVFRTVLRPLAILACVHTEHGEVSGVARPHPVVRVTTVFAYAAGRRTHQANVVELVVHKEVELVAVVERLHVGVVFGAFGRLGNQLFGLFRHGGSALRFRHVVFEHLVHVLGDVFYSDQEIDKEARVRKFFRTRHSPKAIRQVVVFQSGMLLNRIVATVVVGQNQAFRRDDFPRTKAAKRHDGVL